MVVHTRPQRRDSSGAGYGQLSPTLTAALPTVYRCWGSKRELIRQALTGAAGTQLQVPDAGSVDTDLRMVARAVQVARSAPQGAAITTALIVGGLSALDRRGHAAVLGRTA
jgi:hypothetical protein